MQNKNMTLLGSIRDKRPRRSFDEDFKKQAVEMIVHEGKPLYQTARELGLAPWTLRTWKRKWLGQNASKGSSATSSSSLNKERQAHAQTSKRLQEAEARAERYRREADLLKKVVGIISTPS